MDRIVHICTKQFTDLDSNSGTIQSASNSDADEIEEIVAGVPDMAVDNAPRKGLCISCLTNNCDIILLPCFHTVICSKCWKVKVDAHEK